MLPHHRSKDHPIPGALDHLLVLDLTSHLSGPYCAMLLADHGTEVIKIERWGRLPAPRLGEHTDEVLGPRLSLLAHRA